MSNWFVVYKVVCNDCLKGYYEPDEGLKHCPHCGQPQDCVLCMDENIVYKTVIDPFTGNVTLERTDKVNPDGKDH